VSEETTFNEALRDLFDSIGIDATYKSAIIKVDFRKDFIVVEGVETYAPQALCLKDDVVGVTHDDTITIESVEYNIIGIQPGSNGMTILILSEE
jgi:hypothetical protein